MGTALVGLGSNLGDRRAALEAALAALRQPGQVTVSAASSFRQTRAVGGPADQPDYLNAAVRLETALAPRALLRELQAVEQALGRVRSERWGPRTVDLDLLLYDQVQLESPELTLPHPRMSFRRFVLEPAAEVAPEMVHPTTGWTIGRLLEHLNTAKPYVAVVGRTCLERFVNRLAETLDAETIWFPMRDYAYGNEIQGFAQTRSWGPIAEMLGRRSRLLIEVAESLGSDQWPDDAKLRISDFWLDLYRRKYTGSERHDVREAIDSAARPKLLIAWLPPIDENRELAQATPRGKEHMHRALASLRDLVRGPGHGPTLYLDTLDFDTALAESIAAVRAME